MAKLDFILADTTSQALEYSLEELSKKANLNPFENYVVLVPDSKTILVETKLLKLSKNGAFSNIYVYSLKRLLSKIAPTSNNVVLSKVAGTVIMRKIIIDNLNSLVCYKKTATTNGFAETIYGTICQLKSSKVSVADFYDMIEPAGASLKIKMQDIALLYDKYQQFIEDRYLDDSDLLSCLEQVAINSDFIKSSNFYFVGYESVTAGVVSTCKQIINNCKSFVVGASYMQPTQSNYHIADNETYNKFKNIADVLNIKYTPKRYNFKYNADFLHIKQFLYAYPPKITSLKCSSVEVLEANTTYQEIEFVAQKISELIANGTRYKNIGIVVKNLDGYREKLEKIFKEYQFSYFISQPYDFSVHPLFTLIKSYIEICRKHYEASDCIQFLSNILLDCKDIDNFINYVNEFGINRNKFCSKFELYNDKVLTKEEFSAIEAMRVALVDKINYFNDNMKTASDYIYAINTMLKSLNIEDRLNALCEKQKADVVYCNITKQALSKLQETLNIIKQFIGTSEISLETFESLLLSGLTVNDISIIPVSIDSICIGENTDGFFDVDYLFVLDASEGNFPLKQQDCGVITDKEINELSDKTSKSIEPTIKTINRRERYCAYQDLLLARKAVILSYNLGAGEDSKKPSNLIDQLLNIFSATDNFKAQKYSGQFNIDFNTIKNSINAKLPNSNRIIKYLCTEIGNKRNTDGFSNVQLVNSAYSVVKNELKDNLKNNFENLNNKETYNISVSDKLFFSTNKTSTSQMEKYFTCPFLFYTSYGLRIRENASSKLKALDVGNILHEVAEKFIDKLRKNSLIDVKNTAKNIVNKIVNANYVVEDNKFLVQILFKEAERLCENLANEYKHSHFKPEFLEKSFSGVDSTFSGVALNAGGRQILLEGKIDRIDVCGKRFRIIDYKTGKIEDNIKRVFYGKKIQLISYLMAMKNSGLLPAAVVYYPIRNEFGKKDSHIKMKGFYINDPQIIMAMDTTLSKENLISTTLDIKLNKPKDETFVLRNANNLLSDEEFDSLETYVKKLCSIAVEEIISGYIKPSPIKLSDSDRLPCANCEFCGVCGVENTEYVYGRKCFTDVSAQDILNLKGDI